MRRLGGPVPAGYDYVTRPQDRALVRDTVWREWLKSRGSTAAEAMPPPATTRVHGGTVEAMAESIAPLLKSRDNRPMRLRE